MCRHAVPTSVPTSLLLPISTAEPPELDCMPAPRGGSLLDRYDEAMVTAEVR